jgi:alkylation response protein AidB-like acyl-CoA dehydrogenase
MNPEASEGEILIRDSIKRFLEAEAPLARRKSGTPPAEADLRSFWKGAAAIGVTSLLVPDSWGGAGMDLPVSCLSVVAEEMGRVVAPGALLPCNVVADAVARSGSASQRDEWLPAIVSGDCIATWAVGERGERWLPDSLRLSATRHGGDYLLDGIKNPVEAGVEADLLLVTAVTGDGPVQLLVPTRTPGVRVKPLNSLDVARSFAEIGFEGVRVPASAALGDPGTVRSDIDMQIDLALCLQAAETAAMMQAVFDLTIDYLLDRYAFGRIVASYQAIKHRLAEHKVWLEASLALATAAAQAISDDRGSASRLASAAKVHIGDQSLTSMSDCSQLLGGISMTWEHDHHLFLRRATANRAIYGSPTLHRERLCRLAGL